MSDGFGFPPGAGPPGPGRGHGSGIRGTRSSGPLGEDLGHGSGPGDELRAGRSRSTPGFGHVGGVSDPLGIGQLGRSDLDPFAGPGQGNTADIRGMRGSPSRLPPGAVPGARFDPFGPAPPQPPYFGGGSNTPPQPGAVPPPFGGPGPDHEVIPLFPGQGPPPPGIDPRRVPPPFGGPAPDHEEPPPGYEDQFS